MAAFIPFCDRDTAEKYLNVQGHYNQVDLCLSSLLDPTFLSKYLQSSTCQLILHTTNTRLDSDDVFVIDANGKLVMSLTKDTYEQFGIAGRKQTKNDVAFQKHLVEIDLRAASMRPGEKKYERLKWCFDHTLTRRFTAVASLVEKVTGAPLELEWPAGVVAHRHPYAAECDVLSDITIPTLEHVDASLDLADAACQQTLVQTLEWLGLAHLKAERLSSSDQPDPFVSIFRPPRPNLSHQPGVIVRWRGLIPSSIIMQVMTMLRKMMVTAVAPRWTSLAVWGFGDSPLVWDAPHTYHINGDNDYTFLLLPTSTTSDEPAPSPAIGCILRAQ